MHQLFHLKALLILKRKKTITKNNKIISFIFVLILPSALDMKLHTPNICQEFNFLHHVMFLFH